MKTRFFTFFAIFSCIAMQSQGIDDAMRYAQENLNGTARFRAMGGAFGALGGDFSALNVNPAGGAVFTDNQIGLTLSSFNTSNKSNYFGTTTTEQDYAADINQAGAMFVFINDDEAGKWRKITLGLNYENANSFENSVYSAGTNPNNSISNYFLSYANASPTQGGIILSSVANAFYGDLQYDIAQGFLGLETQIILPESNDGNNSVYLSNIPAGGDYIQENLYVSTGYNGKLSINAATQFTDRWYFGINLNSHFTDYIRSSSFFEENQNAQQNQVQRLRFNNELHTFGSGFSFQAGAIAKITTSFRAGLSYESPTWYNLTDEVSQSISSRIVGMPEALVENPNVIVIFEPYRLRTPGKFTGSLAYVFGKTGLLSVDYSIKDYSNVKYTPKNDFAVANAEMRDELGPSAEIRIGAEHRIKQWSLRAGYRFEESPYKNGSTIGDLSAFSAGLGYTFGGTRIDFAYTRAQRDSEQAFFSQGLTDAAKINTTNNNFSVSVLFNL